MASVPSFYSGDKGEFNIPRDRFLQYTEDHIKEQFQSLDQDAINRLKNLPTIFATEQEVTDARIGKITDIEVHPNNLRVKYSFDQDRYPLTKGVLNENRQKLGIGESGYEFHRGHWGIKESDLNNFYEEYLRSLIGIAHKIKNTDKKVQLIYAFNGTGKTRLSRTLKDSIAPKSIEDSDASDFSQKKVLYYSAFTEDLFYWDNDLKADFEPKLNIQNNKFTDWILREQGDSNIIKNFQRYTDEKLAPEFQEEDVIKEGKKTGEKTYPFVTFSYTRGDNTKSGNIKISKGEESNFIWSVFYTLLQEVISILSEPDPAKRSDNQFDGLKYVFIDDPVSSLDENHLIELAVDLAKLIKESSYTNGNGLRFVITTHNPLFYNVLWNEFNNDLYKEQPDGSQKCIYKRGQSEKYRLVKMADGTFDLINSNDHPFSYHLFLLSELREVMKSKQIEKYHFNFLRNILEKTATFLGCRHWDELLPKTPDNQPDPFANRILNLFSHSAHAGEEMADITEADKEKLIELVNFLTNTYHFKEEKMQNAGTN